MVEIQSLPTNLYHPSEESPDAFTRRHTALWESREGYLACWYCGSVESHELLSFITYGLVRNPSGSDWKYGWPHKLYLDIDSGVPSATFYKIYLGNEEQPPDSFLAQTDDYGKRYFEVDTQEEYRHFYAGHSTFTGRVPGTGLINAKFYTGHLKDLKDEPDVLGELTNQIDRIWHIRFVLQADGLFYSAPYRGCQRVNSL